LSGKSGLSALSFSVCKLSFSPALRTRSAEAAKSSSTGHPPTEAGSASLYEHCCRALDRSLAVGVHGLPLMGTGDWNDGMNRVGIEGRGESVWLGWFLCRLVADFAPLARQRGEYERAQRWQNAATGWQAALNDALDEFLFHRFFFFYFPP